MKWLHIDEVLPEEGQKTFQYFGLSDRVYAGFFHIGNKKGDGGVRYFFDICGFLGDDVTYWMPREEGGVTPTLETLSFIPDSPTSEEKERDLYHPRDAIGLFMYDSEGDPNVRLHWSEGEWK